jgi:hypothetical protein
MFLSKSDKLKFGNFNLYTLLEVFIDYKYKFSKILTIKFFTFYNTCTFFKLEQKKMCVSAITYHDELSFSLFGRFFFRTANYRFSCPTNKSFLYFQLENFVTHFQPS